MKGSCMVKKTLETYVCDICGREGARFTIGYPDGGFMALDRCDKHDNTLLKFKDEKGTWVAPGAKNVFKVSTAEDIKAQKHKKA